MPQFKVRDFRNKKFFMVDDEYLNGYAKHLGTTASMVYIALCRHVDKNQECFPSQDLIAEKLGIGKRTVVDSIKKLEKWNILKKEPQKRGENAKWKHNVYTLLDKSEWAEKEPSAKSASRDQVQKNTRPSANTYNDQVQNMHSKETHRKETHRKESERGSQVNELIEKFKEVNPDYASLFKDKTQRKALEELLEKQGKEKVKEAIRFAIAVQEEQYAPVITTPLQLKKKLGELVTYYKRNYQNNAMPTYE